jgi:hypothetical protein
MESLESRMERLTPEQRREVEDFVDFILLKSNIRQVPVNASPSTVMLNTPPVLSADPAPPLQQSGRMQELAVQDESRSPGIPASSPVPEITSGSQDWITRDYMDLGQYEQAPSPVTEAVKKVKRKIIAREAGDTSRHLLDWVD